MKETKEQLVTELIKLRQSNNEWLSGDEARRKELSKMLGARYKRDQCGSSQEQIVYSWPQIYFEIGKLSAALTFYSLEGNVSELEVAVDQLKKQGEENLAQKRSGQ